MAWQWLLPFILAVALPARADDLVSMSQVVAAQAAGVLPANLSGNVSAIYQSGSGNVAETDQTGTADAATITQLGNNFSASITQTSQHDTATVTQIGNGAGLQPITVTQTGPGQSLTITQHR